MLLVHLATAADWAAAQEAGRYTTSTRGRALAEEGFIHLSRADQWQAVRERWYADVTDPLVLLVVETDLVDAPILEEAVPGSEETFPHLYGVLETSAVVRVLALDPAPVRSGRAHGPSRHRAVRSEAPVPAPAASFSRVYLHEVYRATLVAAALLTVVTLGAVLGAWLLPGWGVVLGTLLSLTVGLALGRALGLTGRTGARPRRRHGAGAQPPG